MNMLKNNPKNYSKLPVLGSFNRHPPPNAIWSQIIPPLSLKVESTDCFISVWILSPEDWMSFGLMSATKHCRGIQHHSCPASSGLSFYKKSTHKMYSNAPESHGIFPLWLTKPRLCEMWVLKREWETVDWVCIPRWDGKGACGESMSSQDFSIGVLWGPFQK